MPTEHDDLADFAFAVNDEDSPDLTEAEIEGAIPLLALTDIGKHVGKCPVCEKASVKFHYARRRRKPSMFWRITLNCAEGHETKLVFRIDFV